jgi:hypothetical protein
LKVVLIQASPGIRSRDRLYGKTDFMVQTMRLRLEDSKDRESTHLIRDFYFAFPATSQYTFNHLRWGRFLHPRRPKRLGYFQDGPARSGCAFSSYLRSTTCDRLGPLV